MRIEVLTPAALEGASDDLSHLLRACVEGGASLGFLAPLPDSDAREYWQSIGLDLQSGRRLLLVARDEERIVGTGQLAFETKPNGRHRAEVCKVMVLPSHRGRGIAGRLMSELELRARERSIRLLFLDTSEGPAGARGFYESIGYTYAGGIPGYALDPWGHPDKNAIYFKTLE